MSHEIRRVRLQLEINVMPRETPAEVVDWVTRYFAFFHPNLEAKVLEIDRKGFVDHPVDGLALLESEPDFKSLLDIPVESSAEDLLK